LPDILTQGLIPAENLGTKGSAREEETPELLGLFSFSTESAEEAFDLFECNFPGEGVAFNQIGRGILSLPSADVEEGTFPGYPEAGTNGGDPDCIEDLTHQEFKGLPLFTPGRG
jgi:hypothetical protein